jgi:DNA-binding XRE family transcriptional regulator
MKETRFACDYRSCNRILNVASKKPFRCSMCGHGKMKPVKPRAHCKLCRKPVYANIDLRPDKKSKEGYFLICDSCTMAKTRGVQEMEGELRTDFKDIADANEKVAYYNTKVEEARELNISPAKIKVMGLGDRLKAIRKKLGLNQEQLAEHINLTRRSIINYEKSSRRIPEDIKEWVKTAESTFKHIGRERGKAIIIKKFNEANATP